MDEQVSNTLQKDVTIEHVNRYNHLKGGKYNVSFGLLWIYGNINIEILSMDDRCINQIFPIPIFSLRFSTLYYTKGNLLLAFWQALILRHPYICSFFSFFSFLISLFLLFIHLWAKANTAIVCMLLLGPHYSFPLVLTKQDLELFLDSPDTFL